MEKERIILLLSEALTMLEGVNVSGYINHIKIGKAEENISSVVAEINKERQNTKNGKQNT